MAASLGTTTAHGVAAAYSPNNVLTHPSRRLHLRREFPLLRAKLASHSSHQRCCISPSAVSNSTGKLHPEIIARRFNFVINWLVQCSVLGIWILVGILL